MQKIIAEIADVVLATAITSLTHLQTQFPDNAEVQKLTAEILPALTALQGVVSSL